MEFTIIIICIAVVLITAVVIGYRIKHQQSKKHILHKLQLLGPTEVAKNKSYDYILHTDQKVLLFKVLYNPRNLEISVNNKNYWQLNDKVVSSKKSGTKLEGIYDLVNDNNFDFNKEVRKIYLIYPSAKVLLKAVNESELNFIYPDTDCYGVNLVKFDQIDDLFKNK